MKSLLVLLLALSATPALSQEVLPYLYAGEYCALRRAGVDRQSAIRAAIQVATINSSSNWTYVTLAGQTMRSDIVRGAMAVRELCPQFLQN